MTREEYLKILKDNTRSLTLDEQNEALQYYSDYFEEVNDDAKAIEELGEPEDVAQMIVDKFANALAGGKNTVKHDEEESSSENQAHVIGDALYFEYAKKDVKNLTLNFGAAEIVMIPGKKYCIETRGITEDLINCYLSTDGTLIVNNTKRINMNFWSHDRRRARIVPRILVTIPEEAMVDTLRVRIGAGSIVAKDISLNCDISEFDVGAGNMVLKSINASRAKFQCGMGNLSYYGKVTKAADVDCGMGNVSLALKGDPSSCSYDAKVGLGDFKFNKEKKAGVGQVDCLERKATHFSVNCGMGSVNIVVGE